MKKIITYLIAIIIVLFAIYFSVGNNVPILNSLKDLIPVEYKSKLKQTIFANRYKKIEPVYIVKSNSPNSFELNSDSKIYIYSNLYPTTIVKLDIFGYNTDSKVDCFSTKFKANYLLEFKNFNNDCKNSFYFQGRIKDYSGYQYFYFALNSRIKNNSENLFVLPISNFFNYVSNIWNINNYSVSTMPFVKNSNGSFPISKQVVWSEHTHDAFKNLSQHFSQFDLVYDYDLENFDMTSYKNIFFIAHQEYISNSIMTRVIDFLENNPNRNVLSLGAGNFQRVVNFKFISDKIVQFQYPDDMIDYSKYNLLPQVDYTNCKLENFPSTADKVHINSKVSIIQRSLNRPLGELLYPYDNLNSKNYFEDIECDEGKKLPLLTVIEYNSSKLLQVNADNVAVYFTDIPKLKDKILEILK